MDVAIIPSDDEVSPEPRRPMSLTAVHSGAVAVIPASTACAPPTQAAVTNVTPTRARASRTVRLLAAHVRRNKLPRTVSASDQCQRANAQAADAEEVMQEADKLLPALI